MSCHQAKKPRGYAYIKSILYLEEGEGVVEKFVQCDTLLSDILENLNNLLEDMGQQEDLIVTPGDIKVMRIQ